MNRSLIKIIKVKDAKADVNAFERDASAQALASRGKGEKIERRSRRKIEDTVLMWINERRENKRSEDISSYRTLFGEERLVGKTA